MIWLLIAETISLFSYLRIFKGFFQQDEWFGFSEYVLRTGSTPIGWLQYFFAPSLVHYTPLTLATISIMFSIFGMNYVAFGILSLILHLVNIALVYILAKELLNSKFLGGMTCLLFGTFAAHYHATFWLIANIATHFATALGLISVILFFRYLNTGIKKNLFLALSIFAGSVLFKEISLGLLPVMLLAVWIFDSGSNKIKIKTTKILALMGILYVVFRLIVIPLIGEFESNIVNQSQTPFKTGYNIITVPMKSVSQTIIPSGQLRVVVEKISAELPETVTGPVDSPSYEVFVVEKMLESGSVLVFIAVSILIYFIIRRSRSRRIKKILIFSYLWVLINSFVFAFAPERTGAIFLVDSRNLYFVSVGTAILVTTVVWEMVKTKNKTMVIVLFAVTFNLFWLNTEMAKQVSAGGLRSQILDQITSAYPNLPDKVIVYTESSQSYYGLPEDVKIMPFQSGFGQTLLVWYYPEEKFSREFFEDRFLWEIMDQGYREVGDRGFGYFRDYGLMLQTISAYNLPADSVIAYQWESEIQELRDISKEIRGKILEQDEKK